jgi:hypothetical protein
MRDWNSKRIMQSLGEKNEDTVDGRKQGLGRGNRRQGTRLCAALSVNDSMFNPLIDKFDAGYHPDQWRPAAAIRVGPGWALRPGLPTVRCHA